MDPDPGESPISSLPNELLAAIFEHGLSRWRTVYPNTRLPFEILISHVSRRWRHVAIHLPSLWARIHIDADEPLDLITVYLARSKPYHLHLRLDFWDTDQQGIDNDSTAIAAILDLIVPHVRRWSSLVVDAYFEESIYLFLSRLHRLQAPVLTKLVIGFDEGMESMEGTNFPPRILTGGAPMLKYVRLDMLRCCWPPLAALTTFDLRQPHRSEVVYSRFLETLTLSRFLSRLCVHGGVMYEESWRMYRYSRIQLRSLTSLQLIRPSHLASGLLLAISAPQLQSLWLEGIHDIDLRAFFESPQDALKFPVLQCLVLKAVDLDESSYTQFCRVFPTVSHLTVVCTHNLDKLGRSIGGVRNAPSSAVAVEPPAWPDLRTVVVRSQETYGEQDSSISRVLCGIVSARIAMGQPIQRLVLDAELVAMLDEVGWLRERIQVDEWKQGDDGCCSDDDS